MLRRWPIMALIIEMASASLLLSSSSPITVSGGWRSRGWHALRFAVDLLSIATQAKSFRDNHVLGNRTLNRLGLHAARVIFAHGVMALRRALLGWRLSAAQREEFRRNGFLVVEDFLPPEQFAALREQLGTLPQKLGTSMVQGDTMTQQILIDDAITERWPALRQAVLENDDHQRLLGYVAGRTRVPYHWLQRITSQARKGPPDPQRQLHVDTFQPTMKAWLFLTDADEHNGPFTYVPGSHRLSLARLRWEYHQSVIGRDLPVLYAARGSLRINEDELASLGLPAPRPLHCRANTLVVADTTGFHRRGEAQGRAERIEIWSLCRTNPFNPWVGWPFRVLNRLDISLYVSFARVRNRWRKSVRADA